MELQDLLAPVAGEPGIADALVSWDWLVPGSVKPLVATAVGDLFITDTKGAVWFLDIIGGSFGSVAVTVSVWEERLRDPEFIEHHFMPEFVQLLRERRAVLAQGECYVPQLEPVLGGSWEVDNWSPGRWVWQLERQGRLHYAIKDLPEGTPISEFKYTEL